MNNVWLLLGLIAVIGAGVGFYLFWSNFVSRSDADEANAALPMDGSQVLAQVTQRRKE